MVLQDNIIKVIAPNCKGNMPWQQPFGNELVWRYAGNPIVDRNPTPSIARVFNSGVLPYEDGFIGVFRADHKDIIPDLHLGKSLDGINWEIEGNPIVFADKAGKTVKSDYAYDPRLVKIDDTYYIIWCTEFYGPTLGLASTTDFKTFVRLSNPFFPFNRNGVLFPRKINGAYLLFSRPSDNGHTPFGDIFLSRSYDLEFWGQHEMVMRAGGNWWQSLKIGAGSVPIETDKGWLMFYHGVTLTANGKVYSIGASLHELHNPAKVLLRSKDYILTPELPYETIGFVPNVCFPCASLCDKEGRVCIYYGGADTTLNICFTTVQKIYDYLLNNSYVF